MGLNSPKIPDADYLLARDLRVLAKPANIFRFRIDAENANVVVIDFGHLPPIVDDELGSLQKGVANVHTRIMVPLNLGKTMAEVLLDTIERAEKIVE